MPVTIRKFHFSVVGLTHIEYYLNHLVAVYVLLELLTHYLNLFCTAWIRHFACHLDGPLDPFSNHLDLSLRCRLDPTLCCLDSSLGRCLDFFRRCLNCFDRHLSYFSFALESIELHLHVT